MRFISKFKKYQINFQTDIIEHFATGESRELRPLLNCEFDLYGSMLPHEVEAARGQFMNFGLPTEVDGVTLIDPMVRWSVFDTVQFQEAKGLDDETRERLEQFLLGRHELGADYIMVPTPVLAPPWPTYDTFRGVRGLPTAEAIAKKVREDGYDVVDVLAYERQNANRQDVIDALEAVGTPIAVEDEELVQA